MVGDALVHQNRAVAREVLAQRLAARRDDTRADTAADDPAEDAARLLAPHGQLVRRGPQSDAADLQLRRHFFRRWAGVQRNAPLRDDGGVRAGAGTPDGKGLTSDLAAVDQQAERALVEGCLGVGSGGSDESGQEKEQRCGPGEPYRGRRTGPHGQSSVGERVAG